MSKKIVKKLTLVTTIFRLITVANIETLLILNNFLTYFESSLFYLGWLITNLSSHQFED